MKHRFENHDLTTESCGQFIDITDDVLATVERSQIQNGQVVGAFISAAKYAAPDDETKAD